MKYSTGLTASLAVLLTGLYTWGISTDPDGFGALVRVGERPAQGAVPLANVEGGDAGSALTYGSIASDARQALIFKLAPPDSSALNDEFATFLGQLQGAVADRDVEGVLERSAEDIMLSFGFVGGRAALRDLLSDPEDAPHYWDALQNVLSLPAAKSGQDAHCTPYFNCMALPKEAGLIEPFETVFVVSEDTAVHARPDASSKELMHLSYDVLQMEGPTDHPGWVKVALPAGRTGYIKSHDTRTLFDFRADFEKVGSSWKMTSFMAGD